MQYTVRIFLTEVIGYYRDIEVSANSDKDAIIMANTIADTELEENGLNDDYDETGNNPVYIEHSETRIV